MSALSEWTQHHCSFCDDFLLGRKAHISPFLPGARAPEQALEWNNLYLVCGRCNESRGAKFDDRALRPDALDYEFDRYFAIDPDSGELRPNPEATPADQDRAAATIDLWRLNRDDLRTARNVETMEYRSSRGASIEHFAFRDYLRHMESDALLPHYAIESLTIKDIKCFSHIEIGLYRNFPISLLIGPKACGKTTILQLLALGLCGIERIHLDQAWKDVVRQGAKEGRFWIRLRHDDQIIELPYRIDGTDRVHYAGDAETLELVKKTVLVVGYGVNPNRPAAQQYLADHFDSVQPLVNALFAEADDGQRITLDGYGADQGFQFSSSSSPETSLPLQALSEGFRSTFVWILDLILSLSKSGIALCHAHRAAAIVLLDEIDVHLHPRWQRMIFSALRRQFPKFQFIVTTHSPFVVQALDLRDVISLAGNE